MIDVRIFLKQSSLRIVNGRVCDDQGNCSYMGGTGSSLIDYCIVKPELLPYFALFMSITQIFYKTIG